MPGVPWPLLVASSSPASALSAPSVSAERRLPRRCAGQSGVRLLPAFAASELPVRIGAEIEGFDPRDFLDKKDRKQLKMMVRTIQLAVAGARLALRDAGVEPGSFDPDRFGIAFGMGTIPGDLADLGEAARASFDETTGLADMARWGRDGLPLIPPMWMLNHVPNMPACHTAILNDARGPNNTITQSDAAGVLAVGEASDPRGGRADLHVGGRRRHAHQRPHAGPLLSVQRVVDTQ